jgi:tetratricopeptide (TPR) repeat protein
MIGSLSFVLGEFETARRVLEENLPVHRRLGNEQMIANTLGLLSVTSADPDSALALSREGLEAARKAGGLREAHSLWHVGVALAALGELDDAERTLEEAIGQARALGNVRNVGTWQMTVGALAINRGDYARARPLFEESLAIHRGLDDAWGMSHALTGLAFLALEAGDGESARTLLSEALAIERESGQQPRLANALEMSARLAAADGQPASAIRLYARAALLREHVVGLTFEVGWPDPAPNLDELRAQVGEARFDEEWERGRAMTLLEAIDHASRDRGSALDDLPIQG